MVREDVHITQSTFRDRSDAAWAIRLAHADAWRENSIEEGFMSQILDEVLKANKNYAASFGKKSELPMPPGRHFAILTCMDARLDPAKFAGFSEGDAHVIRNAGGRATEDAIRSLVISYKLLGTKEWFVIHHVDCGMLSFTNEVLRNLLSKSLEPAVLEQGNWKDVGKGGGTHEGDYIEWLPYSNLADSVVADVTRLRNHPLTPAVIPIYGYIFDVKSGKLVEVPEATKIGAAKQGAQSRAA